MKTYQAKKETLERKWFVVDATNQPMGRIASQVAAVVTGKTKAIYSPHLDCGDFVIVLNVEKMVLTGKKLENDVYKHYTGYTGGLKETPYKKIMAEKPEFALEKSIKGMLPKNSIGRKALTRVRIYQGNEHEQTAQQPIKIEMKGGKF